MISRPMVVLAILAVTNYVCNGERVLMDGESKMRRYNEVMTVQQLVDIVSYLQTEYEVVVPPNPYLYRSW